jgi:hypothetical protein
MDGAFFRNLQQLGSLLVRERPREMNVPLNVVEHSFPGFAFGAIGGMDP